MDYDAAKDGHDSYYAAYEAKRARGDHLHKAVIGDAQLYNADCLTVIKSLPSNSIDSIVTDPPYELGFMGKTWDNTGIANSVELWAEVLRVLKPGGHVVAFSGTRTQHRMVCAIEDAGFEIRDQLGWLYGSGFPKSHDISKDIDKKAGATRAGRLVNQKGKYETDAGWSAGNRSVTIDPPATDAAREWQGWGTALKPAWEPICLARKPFKGTVAENVLQHGTGAINIDGCRVESDGSHKREYQPTNNERGVYGAQSGFQPTNAEGRFPANVIHDGSDEVIASFPVTKSGTFSGHRNQPKTKNAFGSFELKDEKGRVGDSGSAARFFYCAKASRKDRDEGMTGEPFGAQFKHGTTLRNVEDAPKKGNTHPTVKPTSLMQYLCRLVTPPGGVILDPFLGSGSTGKAAIMERFRFIGCEREAEYMPIAEARIRYAVDKMAEEPEQRSFI